MPGSLAVHYRPIRLSAADTRPFNDPRSTRSTHRSTPRTTTRRARQSTARGLSRRANRRVPDRTSRSCSGSPLYLACATFFWHDRLLTPFRPFASRRYCVLGGKEVVYYGSQDNGLPSKRKVVHGHVAASLAVAYQARWPPFAPHLRVPLRPSLNIGCD